jgi:O-antigen ligase
VKVLVYSFLLAVSIRHVKDLYTFVWAYVAGCGILAFFSFFVFGITRSSDTDIARLGHLYTYDANDLGVVMMVGLPLTLLLLVSIKGSRRLLLLLILLGISATIARSGSRGGFLGFVAVGVAALILVRSVSVTHRASFVVAALVALMVGAPDGYWKQMGTVLQPKDDYNYSTLDGRKALAERGVGYMMKYPLFGLGMDNFSRAECTISPKIETLGRSGPVRCRAPHNSYVQAGSELGVPGLVVWLSLVFGVIVMPLRLRSHLPRSWRRGSESERFLYAAATFLPLSMIGFAVTAFFVSFAWMEPLYILAAFTTGLTLIVRNAKVRPATNRSVGWRVRQSPHPLGRPQVVPGSR